MKIKLVVLLLCLCPLAAYAAEKPVFTHKAGEVALGLGVKSSTPGLGTDWGEFNIENRTTGVAHDAKPGTPSIGGDLQAVYFVNPWLAVGASVGDEYFDHDIASGVEKDIDTSIKNGLFLVRVYANPQSRYKVYFPLAVGVARIDSRSDLSPAEHFKYTGFAAHAGVGVERLLSETWGLALEARYNYNKFHRTLTNAHNEVYRVYPSINYISMSLRLDYRF